MEKKTLCIWRSSGFQCVTSRPWPADSNNTEPRELDERVYTLGFEAQLKVHIQVPRLIRRSSWRGCPTSPYRDTRSESGQASGAGVVSSAVCELVLVRDVWCCCVI